MKSFVRRLVFSLVLLLQTIGLAQAATTYPVQLNAQVLPPYTNCIGDYVNTSSTGLSRIQVSCLLRDLQHPSYNVGIRMMVVQGSQVKMKTMTQHNERVENNVLHRFNVSDLFQANNVWGKYDADGYCLKEGGYEFVFQAFDGGDERLPLSEPVRVFVYLSQAEPPRPVSPANGECVNYQSSFINFVWMESQVASFNANRKYRIEVYEVPENSENYDQQALINSNATKFTIEDINGMVNFYAMQNTAGRLVKGRTYLWRVQVYDKTTQLTDGKNIYSTSSQYENGGYSEVYSFKFANCQPFEIKTDSIDSSKKPVITKMDTTGSKATVHWLNEPDKYPCGYIVAFNKAEDTLSNWGKVEMGVNDSVYTFKNIEQGVEYVTHIIGIVQCDSVKGKIYSANSADSTFMLPKAPEKDCHNNIDPLTSKASADTLTKGSYFTANDRDIKITEITRSINAAGDTLYTGYGISYCPLLEGKLGIKVKFDSVKINANHELMQGRVYAPSDAANAASLDASGIINEGYTGTGAAPVQTSAYPTYKDTSEIPEGSIGNVNGVLYVKKDGVVTKLGTVEKVTDLKCDIQEGNIDDKVGVVTFTPNGYMNPPYDKNKSPFTDADIEEYYANYKVGTGRYDVPWFAMVEGDSAIIKADFKNVNNEVPDTAITFVCVTDTQAVILESEYLGNHKFSMFIYGGEAQKSLNIYAIYSNNNGDCKTLGRARVLTMPKQKQELILVPVRRAQLTVDSVTIEKQLNSIYQPLGVTYKVHVDEQFGGTYGDKDETYSFLDEGLAVTGSGLFTTETDDMKTLKALYAQYHSIKDSVAYIFILPKATSQDGSTMSVLGDMPRNHQVGYVFSEPTTPYADGLTIAHELGHGLYSFEHTFENNGPTQGSTSNLMDYCDNAQKDLRVWQWNLIYSHKTYTVPFFEADEDGMLKASSGTIIGLIVDGCKNGGLSKSNLWSIVSLIGDNAPTQVKALINTCTDLYKIWDCGTSGHSDEYCLCSASGDIMAQVIDYLVDLKKGIDTDNGVSTNTKLDKLCTILNKGLNKIHLGLDCGIYDVIDGVVGKTSSEIATAVCDKIKDKEQISSLYHERIGSKDNCTTYLISARSGDNVKLTSITLNGKSMPILDKTKEFSNNDDCKAFFESCLIPKNSAVRLKSGDETFAKIKWFWKEVKKSCSNVYYNNEKGVFKYYEMILANVCCSDLDLSPMVVANYDFDDGGISIKSDTIFDHNCLQKELEIIDSIIPDCEFKLTEEQKKDENLSLPSNAVLKSDKTGWYISVGGKKDNRYEVIVTDEKQCKTKIKGCKVILKDDDFIKFNLPSTAKLEKEGNEYYVTFSNKCCSFKFKATVKECDVTAVDVNVPDYTIVGNKVYIANKLKNIDEVEWPEYYFDCQNIIVDGIKYTYDNYFTVDLMQKYYIQIFVMWMKGLDEKHPTGPNDFQTRLNEFSVNDNMLKQWKDVTDNNWIVKYQPNEFLSCYSQKIDWHKLHDDVMKDLQAFSSENGCGRVPINCLLTNLISSMSRHMDEDYNSSDDFFEYLSKIMKEEIYPSSTVEYTTTSKGVDYSYLFDNSLSETLVKLYQKLHEKKPAYVLGHYNSIKLVEDYHIRAFINCNSLYSLPYKLIHFESDCK